MKCRYCGTENVTKFIDLGLQPLSNDYILKENLAKGQHFLPLKAVYCEECNLVQIVNYKMPEGIFNSDYKYFSSFSTSWLEHCRQYVKMIVHKLELDESSSVIEIASNDGYLLQYFPEYGINPLGIEPSTDTAKVAIEKGIETISEFFGEDYAKELLEIRGGADLVICNNVLAHVPFIGDFVRGLKIILKKSGTITLECQHLLNVIKFKQFDTIYHEHFSYLSLCSLTRIFEDAGLKIYDVEKLPTHGGSLRIYVCHAESGTYKTEDIVAELLQEEQQYGLNMSGTYNEFDESVRVLKREVLKKLISIKDSGKKIIGYGAAAKGNTFFNYCGIKTDMIEFVVDANPHKQGTYLPGSLIPVLSPDEISIVKPDYIVIIPWNLRDEISEQLSYVREWGCRFLIFIPEVEEF